MPAMPAGRRNRLRAEQAIDTVPNLFWTHGTFPGFSGIADRKARVHLGPDHVFHEHVVLVTLDQALGQRLIETPREAGLDGCPDGSASGSSSASARRAGWTLLVWGAARTAPRAGTPGHLGQRCEAPLAFSGGPALERISSRLFQTILRRSSRGLPSGRPSRPQGTPNRGQAPPPSPTATAHPVPESRAHWPERTTGREPAAEHRVRKDPHQPGESRNHLPPVRCAARTSWHRCRC